MTQKTNYNPEMHHRKSIRLNEYDYSQPGMYYLTICTHNRQFFFGDITGEEMRLHDAGIAAVNCWDEIPKHFPNVLLDQCIVMPNHVHGIIVITEAAGANGDVGANDYSPLRTVQPPRKKGTSKKIGSIVRGFKIGVTKWFQENHSPQTVWQRNYYEHIIRDDDDLNRIREYIINNPMNWDIDENNPAVKQ